VPFQPIPYSVFWFGIGGTSPPAPVAGQVVSATWPLTVPNPPQPVERFEVFSFTLPISASMAGGPPSYCNVTPKLLLSGIPVFAQEIQITPLTVEGSGYVGGNGLVSSSVSNPISWDSGQSLSIGFDAQVDVTVTELLVVLAGTMLNPSVGGVLTPTPGSIGYDITPVELVYTL